VAFTDSGTAADIHNRRINNSYFVSSHFRQISHDCYEISYRPFSFCTQVS